mmetsp:Transcript_31239/g.99633  ORF Transcript_31239/g.99633 Transcript_31239/m.99633 type:complete len:242 (-) Transcript_31239:495-1220(-)
MRFSSWSLSTRSMLSAWMRLRSSCLRASSWDTRSLRSSSASARGAISANRRSASSSRATHSALSTAAASKFFARLFVAMSARSSSTLGGYLGTSGIPGRTAPNSSRSFFLAPMASSSLCSSRACLSPYKASLSSMRSLQCVLCSALSYPLSCWRFSRLSRLTLRACRTSLVMSCWRSSAMLSRSAAASSKRCFSCSSFIGFSSRGRSRRSSWVCSFRSNTPSPFSSNSAMSSVAFDSPRAV